MPTIKEQLQAAKRCYIILLNNPKDAAAVFRYAVYCETADGLQILWPSDAHDSKKSKETKESGMSYSSNRHYPPFHFAVGGYGYDKRHHIAYNLRLYCERPDLDFYWLDGYAPSVISK